MADMLVKLYNIPHSHDIEESLLKSGIRIKKRDYFHCYEKEQKAIPHVMDKWACYLFIWLYNMCADYYFVDNDYGSGI